MSKWTSIPTIATATSSSGLDSRWIATEVCRSRSALHLLQIVPHILNLISYNESNESYYLVPTILHFIIHDTCARTCAR
jgi:hypothetical protein